MNDPYSPPRQAAANWNAVAESAFFRDYQSPDDSYDEWRMAPGQVRDHWRVLTAGLHDLGGEELTRRWHQARRLMHENGIAYSAYGDPADKPRPWELDPLPLVIAAQEWQLVSRALQQRAQLLNNLLVDLYGPQETLKRGLLPPEILFRHPGYWRAFHGQHPLPAKRIESPRPAALQNRAASKDYCFLHFYAADLARSPDGQWWVLGDRTEAPSGMGYALENRVVVSRILPDAFRRSHVQRLAPYFITVRETLQRLATKHRDNPRVVLLTQGPQSANYFEDAYLARYLGYVLAQGDDLAVRSNHATLKTLGGLLPVDVLWRRPNSEDCDPLELSAQGGQGTAGLLQAARSGNVSVANAFGSGLVESPVLMPFLPRICQELLQEELLLPGVGTWWCGDPAALAFVLDNLHRLVIRSAFRRRGRELEECRELIEMPRDALAERIRQNPADYVAQERVRRSCAPVAILPGAGGGLPPAGMSPPGVPSTLGALALHIKAAPVALRAFAVASGESYAVMPGALGRVSDDDTPLAVSLLTGEGSKDVWVLADSPVQHVSLLADQAAPVRLRRSGADLPSRVADNVYWLGRNLERAESAARLLRTVGGRMAHEASSDISGELPMLLRVLAESGQIEPGYMVDEIKRRLPTIEQGLPNFVLDNHNQGSLRATVTELFRVASVVRDRMSIDGWRIIHRVDQQFRPNATGVSLSELLAMIDEMILDLAAFSGLAMESMTRTHTWRFLDLGRRLERAWQTAHLLELTLGQPVRFAGTLLEALLEVGDSIMTYRSRYLSNLQLPHVLDLLLTDETNPRSVAYQLDMISSHVDALPRDDQAATYAREQRLAMTLLHEVRMLDVVSIAESHGLGDPRPLSHVLQQVVKRVPELSDVISHKYLIHAGPTHQLTEFGPGGLEHS